MVVPKVASATPGAVNPTGVTASTTVAVQGSFHQPLKRCQDSPPAHASLWPCNASTIDRARRRGARRGEIVAVIRGRPRPGKAILGRFWACVDLARVVSAFVVFAHRPVKLIGLCKAAPRPFRNI
jgi:hypothetical protein